MTVIAAVEHSGGVLVGCDTFIGGQDYRELYPQPKWRVFPHLLLATAGPMRPGQVVESIPKLREQRRGEATNDYLVRYVVERIRVELDRYGALDKVSEFNALIAYDGRAYTLLSDFGLVPAGHGYTAIGAGAVGAIHALAATQGEPPRKRVRKAMEACVRHGNHVAAPFHFADVPRLARD